MRKTFPYLMTAMLPFTAHASIQEVSAVQEIVPCLEQADQTTLCVFDIDYTLTMPSSPAFQMTTIKQHKALFKAFLQSLTEQERLLFSTVFISRGSSLLVDTATPNLINSLQEKGVKCLALTACFTGSLGPINNLEEWRFAQLKSLGIDFSSSFPIMGKLKFDALNGWRGRYPVFAHGILFTNQENNNKGDVLEAFLNQINWKPTRIIFIDDDIKNLESMEATLQKLGIEHAGFHYKGASIGEAAPLTEEDLLKAWKGIQLQVQQLLKELN